MKTRALRCRDNIPCVRTEDALSLALAFLNKNQTLSLWAGAGRPTAAAGRFFR